MLNHAEQIKNSPIADTKKHSTYSDMNPQSNTSSPQPDHTGGAQTPG
jgi:hypothetical protein